MAYTKYPNAGVWTGDIGLFTNFGFSYTQTTVNSIDAEAIFVGQVFIDGAAASKTISSTAGKIHWRSQAVTWSTAGTTLRIGVQDVDAVNGPPPRGDGTFDVYGDMVQGTNSLPATSWITTNMGSGSKTIAHGDTIAIVFKMTVRNGSDSVQIGSFQTGASNGFPVVVGFTSPSTYSVTSNAAPNCVIEFDDGTLGVIEGGSFFSNFSTETFQDSTNPDERGNLFQVPHNCKIDAVSVWAGGTAAGADWTLSLYRDPLGTPTTLWSKAVLGEHAGLGLRRVVFNIESGSEVELLANTDYWLAVKATGSANVSMVALSVADASHRRFLFDGLNTRKGTRNNSSGAASETTTAFYQSCVRISHYETGGGSGGVPLIGAGGLIR